VSPAAPPGLLLVNLGTPRSPEPADVRRYLDEFLSDPRVLDMPAWRRRLILDLLILPRRPRTSGEAYAKVWTERGSPLLFHGRDLAAKVQARLGDEARVELAMRYGSPSIAEALDRFHAAGIDRIVAMPLYPQYSSAATGSSIERVLHEAGRRWNTPFVQVVPPFYDHPAYIDAFARVARPVLDEVRPERVLFSFHGLPERQIRKSDDAGEGCLRQDGCCDTIHQGNRNCYRAQCTRTARLLADRLGVPPEHRVLCFQSRLGRTPWIKPYTDVVVRDLAQAGIKRAAILSPGFVADCLETLEELGMRAAEDFRAHGGEELRLVPSLNATDAWAEAVVTLVRESSGWLAAPAGERALMRG
jgi:ferrochelatase